MILLTFLLQTIRIAIPYLLAAAGGVMSERVGIIALGLEGMMLAGAFGAALGSYYGGSPWIGLAGALAAGAMVTAVLAVATLRYKANQVVVGVAINLLVVAATRFYLRRIFDSASNSPRVPGFGGEGAGGMFASFVNPVVWIRCWRGCFIAPRLDCGRAPWAKSRKQPRHWAWPSRDCVCKDCSSPARWRVLAAPTSRSTSTSFLIA